MQEYYNHVHDGFRILHPAMSGLIGQEMSRVYRRQWWDVVLETLKYPPDLPYSGDYSQCIDSLDVANCLRIIERKYYDVFKGVLPESSRAWAKELMGVRNVVAHIGQKDLEQSVAERALDTMVLLCAGIDAESCEEIRKLYTEVRSQAKDYVKASADTYTGLAQPESESARGALESGSLLQLDGTDAVQKTTLTRKVTYGGKTVVYPVYKVRLDRLFFNDQNDRIATWISEYESENGEGSLSGLSKDIYNRIIENFVVESNPESIQKTQKNIQLVGQREPGVTLADGRIVDGNRRFTCMRRIQRESSEPIYFETVLMDMDIQADRKQIKLLELAIQHGEEKKVDYDLIDYTVGTYRDIVQTELLTVEEYAASTNEPVSEVKKRLELAELIDEFLNYLLLPGQFYVAREYKILDVFQEMMTTLHQLKADEKDQLKRTVFNNTMMKAVPDQRKFIRNIKTLIRSETYQDYFADQDKWGHEIKERYDREDIRSKADVDRFAENNQDIREELEISMQRALLRSRAEQMKSKPAENVSKCISLMMEIDSRMLGRMSVEDRENLKAELDRLGSVVEGFRKLL